MGGLALLNGRILDPSQNLEREGTLLIEDGKIGEITTAKNIGGDYERVDVKGAVVAPGFVDVHTHLRDPGFTYREDIESGQRAAVRGGYTTLLCMANTQPVNDNALVTQLILRSAREVGLCNIHPVGAVTKGLQGSEMADIGEMVAAGCVAISDDGRPVASGRMMRNAMEYAKTFKVPVITHAEDLSLSEGGAMNEGAVATRLGLHGVPSVAEESMIMRDLLLAELTGHRLHVAHVSTARGLDMIRQAKKRGVPVTCEVTPHHLTLTDEACMDYNANAKVNPPLRTGKDCEALLEGLNDGTVDCIATDHAPHAPEEKETAFGCANMGLIGLETALPVLLDRVHAKKLGLSKLIRLLTEGPARAFGLECGTLRKGALADVTVLDPNIPVVIRPETFCSKSRNTPFAGKNLRGKVLWTIHGGKIVYREAS